MSEKKMVGVYLPGSMVMALKMAAEAQRKPVSGVVQESVATCLREWANAIIWNFEKQQSGLHYDPKHNTLPETEELKPGQYRAQQRDAQDYAERYPEFCVTLEEQTVAHHVLTFLSYADPKPNPKTAPPTPPTEPVQDS